MLGRLSLPLAALILTVSGSAMAQSHGIIDRNRSSLNKNVFITASVEGEYGRMLLTEKGSNEKISQGWRGYGIRNGLGIEVLKFTQFSVSHTLLNMRSADSGLENLSGSRLAADLAFTFSAPLTNIQFGIGVLADQLQYQADQKSATFVGAGQYYSIGLNYFVSSAISLQAIVKRIETTNNRSGGAAEINKIEAKTDNLSLGIAVWL